MMTVAKASPDQVAIEMPQRSRFNATLIVGLLMATCFLCHFNRTSMAVAGNEQIMKQFGIDKVQMGSVYSAYLLAYTLCMIPGGLVIDYFGAKRALLAMGLGAALLVALTGAAGTAGSAAAALAWLWSVRMLLGIVSVPMHPGAARSVSQWVPPASRALANGLVTAAALLGIASTFFLFGWLIDQFGWPKAFVISGLATGIVTAAWGWCTTEPGRGEQPTSCPSAWSSLLTNRNLILLTLSYAAVGYFQYLFFYWLENYFDEVLGSSVADSRLYSTLPNLAMAGGMLSGGGVSDWLLRRYGFRAGRVYLPMLGMAAGAALLWIGTLTAEPAWIVTWFSLAMAAVGLSEGPFWVAAIEAGGRRGGSAAAIFNTGGNAGGTLAPIITPWLSLHFGWQTAFGAASGFCLFGAALWMWIQPQPNSDRDQP